MTAAPPIPVTVLTGYLGAGKTTLLNRILSENHGRRYAVIVNEFGAIGIDNDLVVDADEEVFEMNNGCICCTVRGDLIRIIEGLMKRKGGFDAIIIETTGLADPAPVAQTFFVDTDVRARVSLDAIVTVVDARHVLARLEDSHEAEEQIAFADVILLNKIDLVDDRELETVRQRIRTINNQARLHETRNCVIPVEEVLERGAFDLDRILAIEPNFLSEDDHEHDVAITSVSVTSDTPIRPDLFMPWLRRLTAERGQDILRLKGILCFPGEEQRYVVQGVHMLLEGDHQRDWKPGETRTSRMVFIGRNLDAAALRQGFAACAARAN
ncbi:CobW family GTP-binding protein [Nitrospirillum iridis]|uniref:G3E family GTPase n=1 Tax=Nitrospirillum iridis TaxID=765888 RepID=A0A7X0B426_9PROT|nr:GTP-binding protein [Nitrospirillum iridis]MBB6254591.1 G3E family GTPase [Nitrospirillum iridis]